MNLAIHRAESYEFVLFYRFHLRISYFLAINKNYPGTWRITILRIIAEGDQVASEVRIDIDGRTYYAVSFYELRDGKIIKETDYWPEPYEAPVWRAQWVEKMDS